MGTRISGSQLDAAAPELSFPLGDNPVSQPALFQTLVGHSVIVVRHVLYCSLVGNFISRHLSGLPPRRCRWLPTCATNDIGDRLLSHSARETAYSLRWTPSFDCIQLLIYRPRRDDRLRLASPRHEAWYSFINTAEWTEAKSVSGLPNTAVQLPQPGIEHGPPAWEPNAEPTAPIGPGELASLACIV